MRYRPEIDGLRAVAVLAVVFFHAGFGVLKGGFVGVDVFFVISGYLITTILLEDLEKKQLNLIDFYERRARRLLPALFVVMLICVPISLNYLPKDELEDFFHSLIAVNLFVSNLLFWSEGGYFDSESSDKPLLHTWSLAVEEQYYFVLPILLMFTWHLGRNRVFMIVVLLTSISLAFCELAWRYYPLANFYILPTRAWELFGGSIAAFTIKKNNLQHNNLLAFLGLLAIIIPMFVYDENTPFPSLYALGPVVGVFLIILYAGDKTIIAGILSNKILVGLGLISYSTYLLHQPILVFARLRDGGELSDSSKIFAILATFIIATVMWKYVETPFRSKKILSGRKIYLFCGLSSLIFIVGAHTYHLIVINRADEKLYWNEEAHIVPKKFRGITMQGDNCSERSPDNPCVLGLGKNQLVIVGDSHARILTQPAYDAILEDKLTLIDMSSRGCPFLLGLNTYSKGNLIERCTADFQDQRMKYISSLNPSMIIIHSRFPLYLHGDGFDNSVGGIEPRRSYYIGLLGNENFDERKALLRKALQRTIQEILLSGHEVMIVSPVPTNGWHPIKKLKSIINQGENTSTAFVRSEMAIPRLAVERRQKEVRDILYELSLQFPKVRMVDSLSIFCDELSCHSISVTGEIFYVDRDHLSLFGAKSLYREISRNLK